MLAADPLASKLRSVVHYHELECFVRKLDCSILGQGHSEVQNIKNVCSGDIFRTTEPFVTKLHMVRHHHISVTKLRGIVMQKYQP